MALLAVVQSSPEMERVRVNEAGINGKAFAAVPLAGSLLI